MLARHRPDATIAYTATSYGLLAALAGATNLIVATAGGDVLVDPFDDMRHKVRNRLILSIVLRRATRVLAWAPHVADRLAELGVPRSRVVVQVRGVDLTEFPYHDRETPADRVPTILSIRLFKPLYDIPTLIRALHRLSERSIPYRAILLGEGPERGRIEAMIAELDLGARVELWGMCEEAEVKRVLRVSDIYVSTSSTDGASASLFEAMAVGLYPIVSDIPANRPWIRSEGNGDLFAVGDDDALSEHLARALADPDRRRRVIETNLGLVREDLDFSKNMAVIERAIVDAVESG